MSLSEPQRAEAIRWLHRAAADGRLTIDEADERIVAARAATTEAEVTGLLGDLGAPSLPVSANPQFEPYPATSEGPDAVAGPVAPGYSPQDPLRLSAGWEGAKKTGVWRVPPFIRASSGVDSVKIDCTLAEAAAPVIDLELVPGAGSVKLIVPDGWGVRIDRLGKSFGSAKSIVDEVPAPGYPLVVVRGGVGLGSFKAQHPGRFQRWQLRRRGIELPPAPNRDLR